MRPLTLDDLLPLPEYAGRRREFFDSLERYLDRYRRVRIGPHVTLLFENRQTLWFHVQELLRVARLADPVRVQEELDLYNRLLPGRNQLQAALLLGAAAGDEAAGWENFRGEELRFCIGEHDIPATLVSCRPEDRCNGTAHWVQFFVDPGARELLMDFSQAAFFKSLHASNPHESSLLSDEVRQSLIDDLELSARD